MLEYAFFHRQPFTHFINEVQALGIQVHTREDEDYFEACLPEDLNEAILAEVETIYERLLDWNQALYEAQSPKEAQTAGVVVRLQNGQTVYASIAPHLLNRILSVLSPEELGEVVDAIVDAVENPNTQPLCKRLEHQS